LIEDCSNTNNEEAPRPAPLLFSYRITLRILGSAVAGGIMIAATSVLTGCGKSTSSSQQESMETVPPLTPSFGPAEVAKSQPAEAKLSATASPMVEQPNSLEKKEAENQLLNVLAQYPSADEETRNDIVEHLADLVDKGLDKETIAKALGSMFAMEQAAVIKTSILDELEALGTPSLFEQVTPALLPNEPLEVRDEAIAILKDLGDKRAISSLQALLADPDDDIREEAEDAIAHLNSLP